MAHRRDLTCDTPFSFVSMGVVFDPLTMTIVSVGMSAIGTLAGASAQQAAGEAANAAAQSKALQMEQQATQARASSQRQMLEKRRQTDLTQSTLQSRAAASGAGAQDDTVLKLGEDIGGRGEQQALMDLYNGENTARGLEDSAKATRVSGQAAQAGANMQAFGTLASGLGTGFGKFASTNPFKLPDASPAYG